MLWLLLACDLPLTDIAITGQSEATIEAGTVLEDLLGDLGFSEFASMDLTHAEELRNQGVAPGDIASAALTEFLLTTTNGAADLSFIETMRLSVSGPALDEVELARGDSFPEGEATVEFQVTGADITDYVVSEAMTLSTEVTAHRPEEDTVVRADWTVVVGVTTQGAVSNLE